MHQETFEGQIYDGDCAVAENDDQQHGMVTGTDDVVPRLSPGEERRAREEARGRGRHFE